jgi:hypothetical protein
VISRAKHQEIRSKSNVKSDGPARQFNGGALVFFGDHVELCGVAICYGQRSDTKRRALELLSKVIDGKFVAYSGDELAQELGLKRGKHSVAGVIRDLRQQITDALLGDARIECKRCDVIMSRDSGYRLSPKLSVQHPDRPKAQATPDTDDTDRHDTDDTNDTDRRDTDDTDRYNAALTSLPNVRRDWIMDQLMKGVQLKVFNVTEQFRCSPETAKRDLKALKGEGLIEFLGIANTGHYRITDKGRRLG